MQIIKSGNIINFSILIHLVIIIIIIVIIIIIIIIVIIIIIIICFIQKKLHVCLSL